ncbi:MAG: alpha/beta hydrolase [Brevundimonas sp.]|nr:MAG: alpha/beta hydrolase [Brevundimonas sp.]
MKPSRQPFVDPDTARLLADMAVDFSNAPADPTVEERRQGLNIAADLYGPEPARVAAIEHLFASGPHGAVPLRIYRPAGAARRPRPVVAHIHGGGWVLGDPDGYERVCRAYCAAGDCVVVDIDYRRAPEHKHPVALEDCLAALDWIAANSVSLGGDPGRLVVTGDSAGGHLAAAVCQETSVPVALQVLVYPVMSASARADFPSRKALGDGRYFLREFDILRAETEYFTPDEDRERAPASPLLASTDVLARQPRTLVVTAGLDPLCDEGAAYVDALRSAGAEAREHRVPGTIHGFILFAGRIPIGLAAIAEIGREIQSLKT